jgi:hypothetical protein
MIERQITGHAMSIGVIHDTTPSMRSNLFRFFASGEVTSARDMTQDLSGAGNFKSLSNRFIRFTHGSTMLMVSKIQLKHFESERQEGASWEARASK